MATTLVWKVIFYCLLLIGLSNTSNNVERDWAVKINGGKAVAAKIANDMQFEYLGPIGNLEDIYHFKKTANKNKRKRRSLDEHTEELRSHPEVIWADLQTTLIRKKRDKVVIVNRVRSSIFDRRSFRKRKMIKMFNDPRWPEQWYLFDTRSSEDNKQWDFRVVPVWELNITGNGVKLTIIDDGLEHTHPDLKENYDPLCSKDINGNDDDPTPDLSPGTSNEHGTRCAAEIAMSANNKVCGVGVAYNSKIGGIRLLDGPINGIMEAKAFGFNNNHIDIYSASWGPNDDGKTMEKPSHMVDKAFKQGTKLGRNGKGNIYVFASGNGGIVEDSCSCDGYVSSMYVISISSISPANKSPIFTEKCPSSMASTFSSSPDNKDKLIVADVNGKCTDRHSGTSASAPYAAGIFALVLEANPNLTWRDLKYLITWTSQYKFLKTELGWKKNAAGYWVNTKFGFGLLDAYKMVKTAQSWKTVPEQKRCKLKARAGGQISNTISKKFILDGTKCGKKIKFIENVIVKISFIYQKRGALQITLMSPNGMNTTLLPSRLYDDDGQMQYNWPLNSVHNWGESPEGNWMIFVEDKRNDNENRSGSVTQLALEFHGTNEIPNHVKSVPGGKRPEYNEYDEKDSKQSVTEYSLSIQNITKKLSI